MKAEIISYSVKVTHYDDDGDEWSATLCLEETGRVEFDWHELPDESKSDMAEAVEDLMTDAAWGVITNEK